MIDVTKPEEIRKLDPKDVAGSTGMLADQCEQVWQDGKTLQFPQEYASVENIVISGMGGSAYGGHVMLSMFKNELKVPLVVNSDYSLPGFVNEKTLVLLTSYSGSTEEALFAGKLALEKKAKVAVLTGGGKLAEFAKQNNLPAFVFNPIHNPSGQPRLGTGYVVFGTISIFNNLQFLTVSDAQMRTAVVQLRNLHDEIKTLAIDTARKLIDFMPLLIAAEFLEGNAHIMRNQFNETAKSFSAFAELPELNHHLMEGLKNPTDRKIKAIILNSPLYSTVLQKRVGLTKEVIEKNNIVVISITAEGEDKLSQMLYVLAFGGYVTLYLALLYGLDPSLIPWVDYFKEKLQ